MAGRILFVRLRFLLVLAGAFAVVANWEFLQAQWEKLTRPVRKTSSRAQGPLVGAEYWCPMCPGVLSDEPGKCPVCNMPLQLRQHGDMAPSSDGSLARMQF